MVLAVVVVLVVLMEVFMVVGDCDIQGSCVCVFVYVRSREMDITIKVDCELKDTCIYQRVYIWEGLMVEWQVVILIIIV